MKRFVPLGCILTALIAAITVAHFQRIGARPSAYALLSVAADAEHEATRLPSRLDTLSDADEVRIGDALASEYTARWKPVPQQQAIEAYLQGVGDRASARARRKLPYKFHYVPDKHFVNAFALPGGHVFVGKGLINLMKSEDALAAVLGHEVEHVDLRHCAERVQIEAHVRKLEILGPLGGLVALPVEVFVSGYSKEQESDADRDGTTLAVEAGYSPQGILQLLEEFKKLERQAAETPGSPVQEAAQLTVASLQGYFDSHPPAAEREAQTETLIRVHDWPSPTLTQLSRIVADGRR